MEQIGIFICLKADTFRYSRLISHEPIILYLKKVIKSDFYLHRVIVPAPYKENGQTSQNLDKGYSKVAPGYLLLSVLFSRNIAFVFPFQQNLWFTINLKKKYFSRKSQPRKCIKG